jgi:hypothetical protein
MRSHVATAVKINGPLQREHKYINLVMHNQDWERWAAFMCFCFGQELLYAQINDLAIQVGTMLSKVDDTDNGKFPIRSSFSLTDLFSTYQSGGKHSPRAHESHPILVSFADEGSQQLSCQICFILRRYRYSLSNIRRMSLIHSSLIVPVYDVRQRTLDFDEDLSKVDTLPRWKGEVPVGAFVVVGYTASTYQSPRSRGQAKVEHVSCNLLWIIVCGTPIAKKQ